MCLDVGVVGGVGLRDISGWVLIVSVCASFLGLG